MIQASAAPVEKLLNRGFDEVDLRIIYIAGMHFGDQCVSGAVGVDAQGNQHVLGIQEGVTENAAAAKSSQIWAELHEKAFRGLTGAARVVVLDNLREGVLTPAIYDLTLNPLYYDVLRH
jgi:transposase-like protein